MSYQYQSKIDMVTDLMRALRLPAELQERTLDYYEYLWNRHRTFAPSATTFTEDLSPTLRSEILLHLNQEAVLNCDFFRDVGNQCLLSLVHAFDFAVFLRGDLLAEENQLSAQLVFLVHGAAKAIKSGQRMPISLLSPGDYFGERSLLMHHRNAVSIVALENCDTRVLRQAAFEDLCAHFPELREATLKRSNHQDMTESVTTTSSAASESTRVLPEVAEKLEGKEVAGCRSVDSSQAKLLESLVDLVTTLNSRVAEVVERQKKCDEKLRRLLQPRSKSYKRPTIVAGGGAPSAS